MLYNVHFTLFSGKNHRDYYFTDVVEINFLNDVVHFITLNDKETLRFSIDSIKNLKVEKIF